MKRLRLLLLLSALLGMVACGGQGSSEDALASSGPIIVTNGTVVDGRGSEPIRDGIVVIVEDRIAFVGRASDYSDTTPAQVIDAGGGTILPGIIDSHIHSGSNPAIRREFLMSGVTAICDLGASRADMPQFAQDHLDQNPVARGFHAGPIITAIDGLPGVVLRNGYNYEVGTPDEARAAVVELYDQGVDVIKVYLQQEGGAGVYPMLSEEQLAAIVDEAHALGLLVRAHVTYASLLGMAIQGGADVIEHVPVNLTQAESQSISDSQWQALLESDDPLQLYLTAHPQYEAQLEMMVEAGVVVVPTMDRLLGEAYRASNPTPEQEVALAIIVGLVRRFHEFGGVVGLGTDFTTGVGMEAGMPVGEMEMLLASGLTPMEVIEAGTRVAAAVCGHGGELGTLESGMLADVIVVDGDPLDDIQAMDQVVLVIRNGEIAVISDGMLQTGE